jgi:mannose-6-phosphate isomerase-like protein (cupin superfamily)
MRAGVGAVAWDLPEHRRQRRRMKVIVHNPSADALRGMTPVDLATVTSEPPSPIGTFDFHGCICGIGSFSGQPPWELHTGGDELLHILGGECDLTFLEPDGEVTRKLHEGDLVIVPQGCWHSNDAPNGVTMLFMTPSEGNRHSVNDPRTKQS